MTHCAFCNKEKTVKSSFNYDHLNMFDKLESVGTLVYNGNDIEIIINEVKKCQLLCVDCHSIVTKIEQKLGFTLIKINMKKEFEGDELIKKQKNMLICIICISIRCMIEFVINYKINFKYYLL